MIKLNNMKSWSFKAVGIAAALATPVAIVVSCSNIDLPVAKTTEETNLEANLGKLNVVINDQSAQLVADVEVAEQIASSLAANNLSLDYAQGNGGAWSPVFTPSQVLNANDYREALTSGVQLTSLNVSDKVTPIYLRSKEVANVSSSFSTANRAVSVSAAVAVQAPIDVTAFVNSLFYGTAFQFVGPANNARLQVSPNFVIPSTLSLKVRFGKETKFYDWADVLKREKFNVLNNATNTFSDFKFDYQLAPTTPGARVYIRSEPNAWLYRVLRFGVEANMDEVTRSVESTPESTQAPIDVTAFVNSLFYGTAFQFAGPSNNVRLLVSPNFVIPSTLSLKIKFNGDRNFTDWADLLKREWSNVWDSATGAFNNFSFDYELAPTTPGARVYVRSEPNVWLYRILRFGNLTDNTGVSPLVVSHNLALNAFSIEGTDTKNARLVVTGELPLPVVYEFAFRDENYDVLSLKSGWGSISDGWYTRRQFENLLSRNNLHGVNGWKVQRIIVRVKARDDHFALEDSAITMREIWNAATNTLPVSVETFIADN